MFRAWFLPGMTELTVADFVEIARDRFPRAPYPFAAIGLAMAGLPRPTLPQSTAQ